MNRVWNCASRSIAMAVFIGSLGACAISPRSTQVPEAAPSPQAVESGRRQIEELQQRIDSRLGDVQIVTAPPMSGEPRCNRVSQAAAEICDAASRICDIARELRETDATRACRMAQKDCNDARSAADRCTH